MFGWTQRIANEQIVVIYYLFLLVLLGILKCRRYRLAPPDVLVLHVTVQLQCYDYAIQDTHFTLREIPISQKKTLTLLRI
jgi:hypothetical protein